VNPTIAVDSTRNQVYVVNCESNNVSVVNGATNAIVTVKDSNAVGPVAVAVDPATNKIYVANAGSNTVSVINEKITEKHYSAWIKGRQERSEQDVRKAWPSDFALGSVTTAPQSARRPKKTRIK
jgi:DNA-binding beta-propeller fold protein YncE